MRQLLNIGIVFVLILSCSGRALAGTSCPHGCHALAASHTHAGSQQGSGQPTDHCHSMAAGDEGRQATDTSGYEFSDAAGFTRADATGAQFSGLLNTIHAFCDHCIGRAELPSSSLGERENNQSGREELTNAPTAVARPAHGSTAFVKEIIPSDDGPPSAIHRHVLISVFRI